MTLPQPAVEVHAVLISHNEYLRERTVYVIFIKYTFSTWSASGHLSSNVFQCEMVLDMTKLHRMIPV